MLPLSVRRPAVTILLVAVVGAIVHAVSTIGGPLPGPLPLFPPDNWWNLDVSSLPLDPGSDAFMNFVGRTRQAHPDFGGDVSTGSVEIYGYPYVVVDSTVPLKTVQFDYSDESDGVDHTTNQSFPFYPIPDEAITQPHWIENGEPGNQDLRGSSDRHMLIVDKDQKRLFELFSVFYDGTQWHAGSGAFFDLTTNARRPDGWTSADAAGLAMLPGLVRYDEVYGTAEINHAFRVTVRSTNGYVYPASHRAGSTSGALPMGARLRMKQAKNISTYPADMQKIFRAMKKYGLIVADNGSDLYVSGTYDTRWNNNILNPAFHSLTGNDFEVVQLGIKPAPVTADSVLPASGSGSAQTFTLTYSDGNGAADLATAWAWINATFASTSANSCLFYYNRPTNALLLLNDAGTAWTPAALGAAGTLQNSQCAIAMGSSTTVSSSGNTLTINVAITFKPSFSGAKNFYQYAAGSSSNSGWQTRGTWTVSGAAVMVTADSASPSNGSGLAQTFALQYSDTLGAADLTTVWAWFSPSLTSNAASSCLLYFDRASGTLFLLNDAATQWTGSAIASAGTLQNSQCRIALGGNSTAVPGGTTLTLNLAVTFASSYSGTRNIYMYGAGAGGTVNSGWQARGSWTVVATTVTADSVSPSSGTGAAQAFAFQYSDSAGATDLATAWVWLTPSFGASAAQSCMLYYNRPVNTLYLLNDAGTQWTGAIVGTSATLQNSQCSASLSGTTASLAGTTLTLSVPLTFAPAFTGSKNIFIFGANAAGLNSGWQSRGAWNVP
jgi:hypothetical protein